MARFFFTVVDGCSEPDTEGTDLHDVEEAKNAAVEMAGQIIREDPEAFRKCQPWQLKVRDASGTILFTIHVTTDEAAHEKASQVRYSESDIPRRAR